MDMSVLWDNNANKIIQKGISKNKIRAHIWLMCTKWHNRYKNTFMKTNKHHVYWALRYKKISNGYKS